MFDADDVETPSPLGVVRDGLVSILLVATAAAIERVSDYAFPHGVPLIVRACLLAGDLALLMAFLVALVRLLKGLRGAVREIFSPGVILRQIRDSGLLAPVWRAYRTAVGAGSITGACVGFIVLLLIVLSSAPLWVRIALFSLGAMLVIAGIAVMLVELSMLNAPQVGKSGGCFFGLFLVVLIPGLLILSLTFTAQMEAWTVGLRSFVAVLLRWQS